MIKFIEKLLDTFFPMGVKFGEIDSGQILDNEFRSKFLEKLLDWFVENNRLKKPTKEQFDKMQDEIVKELQEKYPHSGIKLNK